MPSFSFKHIVFLSLLSAILLPPAARAQLGDNRAVMDRMDRLERDINLMQRQVARGGRTIMPSSDSDSGTPSVGSAQQEVRLTAIEEELRGLRGKVEENDFQVRRLSEQLDRLQKDTDFRFNELSGNPTKPPGETAPATTPEAPHADTPPEKTTAGDGALKAPAKEPAANEEEPKSFDQPRDHYNYAFRLLNQTRYEEAAGYFESFTKKYPKDPLIGNAYYWLGESFYIRRDYVKAADSFREGFERLPNGPKAADNLLKLAMTLDALKRGKDACTVLDQLLTRYKKSAANVAQKAETERTRMGCKS